MILLVLLLIPVLMVLQAWWIMVLWGALGSTFFETGRFRTIGFGTAMLVSLALAAVGGFFRSTSSK